MPKKGAKVVVAMSGGVDSSVAAAWLKTMGYQVIGISLQLHDYAAKVENKFGTCCSLSDISDARRVCEKMDIPFYVKNMETEFNEAVIDDFVHEYLNGRTPNPCVKCNEKVKFSRLMDWAMDLGADYLATGHYANVRFNTDSNEYELCKGKDPGKDQSYFLFTMRQQDLGKTLFPVGGLEKKQVRELARELGLAIADKPDSQEICFVQEKSYKDFIEERVPASMLRPGLIVDPDGRAIGEHPGVHHFTIGQRKGIGVHGNDPVYVISVNQEKSEVTVGPETLLFKKSCSIAKMNWVGTPELDKPHGFSAKIRSRSKESPVIVRPMLDRRVDVLFTEPQRAITPGQALVLYQEDRLVGGGWIESVS